jgi:hypothetical protein
LYAAEQRPGLNNMIALESGVDNDNKGIPIKTTIKK